MSKCSSCGRNLGSFSFGKKLCRWCIEHEAAQRGENNDYQRVMPTPWSRSENPSISFNLLFLGINLLVFVAMVMSGISISGPTGQQMIRWGGNFGPLTLGEQPWRLITYMFLHYGIIHIGFNMWCLWDLGGLAESLYGDWTYAILYLLCGLGGGVASLAWHPATISAGASGAIFGVAGALIASLKLGEFTLPGTVIAGTLRSVVMFAGYNLVFGALWGRTDNACHIGGFVTGLILGALIALAAPERESVFQRVAICVLVLGILAGSAYGVLRFRGYVVLSEHGSILLEQGKTDEAIAEFRRVIRVRPDDAGAHLKLAQAFSVKGNLAAEQVELQRVLELEPRNEIALYNLGVCYVLTGHPSDARSQFNHLLQIDPNSSYAHTGLGWVAAAEHKDDLAVQEFQKSIELDDQSEAYFSLGTAFTRLQRYDEAISALRRQQEINGDSYETELALEQAYRENGMGAEAANASQKAAALKPH